MQLILDGQVAVAMAAGAVAAFLVVSIALLIWFVGTGRSEIVSMACPEIRGRWSAPSRSYLRRCATSSGRRSAIIIGCWSWGLQAWATRWGAAISGAK